MHLYEGSVIYKTINICDHSFRFWGHVGAVTIFVGGKVSKEPLVAVGMWHVWLCKFLHHLGFLVETKPNLLHFDRVTTWNPRNVTNLKFKLGSATLWKLEMSQHSTKYHYDTFSNPWYNTTIAFSRFDSARNGFQALPRQPRPGSVYFSLRL